MNITKKGCIFQIKFRQEHRKSHVFVSEKNLNSLKIMIRRGDKTKQIAEALDLSEASVRRHRKSFEEYGEIIVFHKEKSNAVNAIETKVSEIIQLNNSLTLTGIKENLNVEGISTSNSTICRALKNKGIVRKRTQKIPLERNSGNNIQKRLDYCRMLSELEDERLVFLDETGVNLHINDNYGYAPKGVTPTLTQPANRGTNISCLVAITLNGVLCYQLYDGPVNSNDFMHFLQVRLLPVITNNSIIIMDNARIHKSAAMNTFMRTINMRIEYLPPYSPQLNPIEEYFSKFKYNIRRHQPRPTTRNIMKDLVDEILNSHSNFQMIGYFRHMRMFVQKGYRGETF